MVRRLQRLIADEAAATAVEYGLIISLVVLAMIGGLVAVADATTHMWNNVSTASKEASEKAAGK